MTAILTENLPENVNTYDKARKVAARASEKADKDGTKASHVVAYKKHEVALNLAKTDAARFNHTDQMRHHLTTAARIANNM